MFYTSCEGVCRVTKQDMQQIEASLPPAARERVQFVLVTLDPAHDTAAALRAYRRAEGLSAARWTLLRGEAGGTRELAAALGVAAGKDGVGRFVHSSELVLLDGSGRVLRRDHGLHADLAGIAREIETATTGAEGGT